MLKRSPLKRKTYLKRKTPLRSVGKTSYRRRTRDFDFMHYVLWKPCELKDLEGAGTCEGRVQADHVGWRPYGQKAPDDTCIALCEKHHRQRTNYFGYFRNWTGHEMRTWCDRLIHLTQNLYQHLVALRQTPWRAEGSPWLATPAARRRG